MRYAEVLCKFHKPQHFRLFFFFFFHQAISVLSALLFSRVFTDTWNMNMPIVVLGLIVTCLQTFKKEIQEIPLGISTTTERWSNYHFKNPENSLNYSFKGWHQSFRLHSPTQFHTQTLPNLMDYLPINAKSTQEALFNNEVSTHEAYTCRLWHLWILILSLNWSSHMLIIMSVHVKKSKPHQLQG